MEHRWGHRRQINKPVRLTLSDGRMARGRLCNLSVTGAWIASSVRGKPSQWVEVHFTRVYESRRTAACVPGMIVRTAPSGFAVEWFDFAPGPVLTLLGQSRVRDLRKRGYGLLNLRSGEG